jgi:hypothetical protein
VSTGVTGGFQLVLELVWRVHGDLTCVWKAVRLLPSECSLRHPTRAKKLHELFRSSC